MQTEHSTESSETCECTNCAYKFKHQTLDKCPDRDGVFVGVTILDESPGFTGIYLRTAKGLLWPARTVNNSLVEHCRSVVAAWMEHEVTYFDWGTCKHRRKPGINEDIRTVKP